MLGNSFTFNRNPTCEFVPRKKIFKQRKTNLATFTDISPAISHTNQVLHVGENVPTLYVE